jgi:predicted DNA-binding protein
MASAATTIKVPRELRDRISAHAKKAGEPAAAFLTDLLDAYERAARFEAVRFAHATADERYRAETAEWDALGDEGLQSD